MDMGQLKEMVQGNETIEKSVKTVKVDSFKRLQEKVQRHGELLSDKKGLEK